MSVEFKRQFSPKELGYKLGHLFGSPQACLSAAEILYDGNPVAQAEFHVEASKAWELSITVQAEIARGIIESNCNG